MSDSWLEGMIAEITQRETELLTLKRAANTFHRTKELPVPYPDADGDQPAGAGPGVRLRPDQYYGKPFAAAARDFLERRKQASSADEVLRALEDGGFDFEAVGWKDDNRSRTVAMSMAKNTPVFHRLPNGLFGLSEWYPDAIERKKGKKDDAKDKSEAASE